MHNPKRIERPAINKIIVMDSAVSLILLLVTWLIAKESVKSVLVGVIIFLIPHIIFSCYAFKEMGAARIKQVTRAFYRAESSKFALTMVLFAYSFLMLQPINSGILIIAYVVLIVVHQFSAFFFIGWRKTAK